MSIMILSSAFIVGLYRMKSMSIDALLTPPKCVLLPMAMCAVPRAFSSYTLQPIGFMP